MKRFMGLRCSNSDYTYAIISGTLQTPVLEKCETVSFPKGYTVMQQTRWFYQDISSVIVDNQVSKIAIKGTELLAQRGNEFVDRVMFEGITYLAASDNHVEFVERRVNSTIAKKLGLKGKGSYVKTKLDHGAFANFEKLSPKKQDAINAGWSMIS
jgi:hypothetical protein